LFHIHLQLLTTYDRLTIQH